VKLLKDTVDTHPVVALCLSLTIDASPEVLEETASGRLARARQVLAWTSAQDVTPIGIVTATTQATYFRPVVPYSLSRRQLFGLGGSEADYQQTLLRLASRARDDDRFAFSLALYHDALKEENAQFRIARLFNVLEALASGLKSKWPSRQAVKRLLGLASDTTVHMRFENEEYRFDAIEIAGRIRDKLFHGTPFCESDLNEATRQVFTLINSHPAELANVISGYCELELNRWANGKSLGQRDDTDG
jgi:hypothetical protein